MQGLELFLYNCENCCLVFWVETKFEDQGIIVCPSCQEDDHLEDVALAEVIIIEDLSNGQPEMSIDEVDAK